jgi:hypothetical protein
LYIELQDLLCTYQFIKGTHQEQTCHTGSNRRWSSQKVDDAAWIAEAPRDEALGSLIRKSAPRPRTSIPRQRAEIDREEARCQQAILVDSQHNGIAGIVLYISFERSKCVTLQFPTACLTLHLEATLLVTTADDQAAWYHTETHCLSYGTCWCMSGHSRATVHCTMCVTTSHGAYLPHVSMNGPELPLISPKAEAPAAEATSCPSPRHFQGVTLVTPRKTAHPPHAQPQTGMWRPQLLCERKKWICIIEAVNSAKGAATADQSLTNLYCPYANTKDRAPDRDLAADRSLMGAWKIDLTSVGPSLFQTLPSLSQRCRPWGPRQAAIELSGCN